ncbi:MAG TPA: DUF4097 family beta strand repeat-containing protein [Gemmatimonadales bacterium]|nr:DUF4097 family beta strand repeat-containing protein [Gemmatimonadales bacterium]
MSRNSFRTSLLTAAALAVAVPLSAQTPERVTLTGAQVAIWDIAGTVSLTPASGRAVTVAVTRRGRDAGQLQLAQGTIRGRETLRVIFPGDQVVYPTDSRMRSRWSSDLRVRDDGTFGGDNYRGRDDGRRVRVTSSGSGTEAAADLEIGVPAGQELAIYLAVGSVTARNIDGKILLDTHAAGVTATGMKGDLDIDTGSGDVSVNGMVGPLRVDVGSGSVDLADVSGGDLDVDAGSGDVRGTGVTSTALNIDTGSGDVELAGLVAQDVKVDVGSGDVTLAWTGDPGDVDIDSGSGEVRLTMPAASGATVDLESSSGDINSDFPISTTRIERDALRGSFGDGRGRIVVETGSGDVSILKR